MAQGPWELPHYNLQNEDYQGPFPQENWADNHEQDWAPALEHSREPKPGWAPSNQDRYKRFYTTLLHGTDWSAGFKYFALYWLRFHDEERRLHSPMFENDAVKHVEEHLVDHLRLLLSVIDKDRLVSVTILQNSSPCALCAERYASDERLTELARRPNVDVAIVFSSLHRIRRPNCRYRYHSHVDDIDVDAHRNNLDGLKTLRSVGYTLRTTTYSDWNELRIALQLQELTEQDYNSGNPSRHEEDEDLREDLEFVLEH